MSKRTSQALWTSCETVHLAADVFEDGAGDYLPELPRKLYADRDCTDLFLLLYFAFSCVGLTKPYVAHSHRPWKC
jgi:hypothetical protein